MLRAGFLTNALTPVPEGSQEEGDLTHSPPGARPGQAPPSSFLSCRKEAQGEATGQRGAQPHSGTASPLLGCTGLPQACPCGGDHFCSLQGPEVTSGAVLGKDVCLGPGAPGFWSWLCPHATVPRAARSVLLTQTRARTPAPPGSVS